MTISKVLVTGGAGFIGSHIVDELVRRNIETYVIDDLSSGSIENLQDHKHNNLLHLIIGDVKKINEHMSDVNDIDVVFHEAAIASVPKSISNPSLVHDVNVNATIEILNFCRKKGIKRLVFASTAAVYGTTNGPVLENMLCKPISPYGASKLSVENYLDAYNAAYGIETVALRYLNVYGPRQIMNDYSGVITIFINSLLSGQPPTIHGDGKQTRDFIHVKDVVQANILAMESNHASGKRFNVASGNSITILELFETLRELIKAHEISPKFGPAREGDIKYGAASADKIKSDLGFEQRISMREGLADVVQYLKTKKKLLQGLA